MEALRPLGVASVYNVMFDCFEVAIVRVICPAVLVKWPADCFILCSAAAMHSIDTDLKYGNPYYQYWLRPRICTGSIVLPSL